MAVIKLQALNATKKSLFKNNGAIHKETVFENTQKTATESLRFGLEISFDGYNIFALGEPGLGKHEIICELAHSRAIEEKIPDDYVYVFNFKNPDTPMYLQFPPGNGYKFASVMEELIESLRKEIPKLFESKDYETEKASIVEKFQEYDRQIFETLSEDAKGRGLSLERGVDGFAFVPTKDGEVLDEEKFSKLSEREKKEVQDKLRILQGRLKESIKLVKEAEKETKRKLIELEKRMARAAISYHIDELKENYNYNPKILEYLNDVMEDVLNSLEDFKQSELPVPTNIAMRFFKPEPSFIRYKVNVFIDRSQQKGAPVIYETNPSHFNLVGRVEYRIQMGMAVTDFTLIKAGALHRANGGYLILDALDVFRNPFSYDVIKRAIKNKEIRIEDPMEPYRAAPSTLKPEPIPIDTKLILIGNPMIYYILFSYDEDFPKIFKVKADFEQDLPWNEESENLYAFFVNEFSKKEKTLPFDDSGIQRIIEYGSRLVDDQKKLSMKVEAIATIVQEASFIAQKEKKDKVYREDVVKAIQSKKERHNKIERRIQEMLLREILLVATDGERVGTINGLSVYDFGDYRFGRPSRITAKVSAGKEGIVHLDREAKLSGKIHDKGSMVITAYLNSKFGQEQALGLNATICFEQLYGMVEGDSASVAEAVVVQSAIGNIPIKQNFAVTGSVNQHGDVQAIGGVNEKIEGFYEVCKDRKLTGTQGVIIPKANMQHLALNEEVAAAIENGQFHLYAVDTVDEAMEILTGLKAGNRSEDTKEYSEGTANYMIEKIIKKFNEKKDENKKNGKKKKKEAENDDK